MKIDLLHANENRHLSHLNLAFCHFCVYLGPAGSDDSLQFLFSCQEFPYFASEISFAYLESRKQILSRNRVKYKNVCPPQRNLENIAGLQQRPGPRLHVRLASRTNGGAAILARVHVAWQLVRKKFVSLQPIPLKSNFHFHFR